MAKEPVLIDSSYYIGQSRQGKNPLRLLPYLAVDRDLVVCGMIRCEVGRGIREAVTRQAYHQLWDVMINVIADSKIWQATEQVAWDLDRQGIILPIQDVFIACCAARVDAVVLTHDRHFTRIPGCKVAFTTEELL